MDTMSAFARGQATRNREQMVFDWDKAARLIRERGAKDASAGLAGDWGYTGGTILADGEPSEDYTYLASTWARPELEIDGEIVDCFRMESEAPSWDSGTRWPESAIKILRGEAP
jgi:hypothetical protein